MKDAIFDLCAHVGVNPEYRGFDGQTVQVSHEARLAVLNAMGETRPDDVISPYSPSHRGFLNTWHIACAAKLGVGASDLINYPDALLRERSGAVG